MRVWEPVEISVNKIDVEDIITTSFGSFDTPPVSGGGLIPEGSGSQSVTDGFKDN